MIKENGLFKGNSYFYENFILPDYVKISIYKVFHCRF